MPENVHDSKNMLMPWSNKVGETTEISMMFGKGSLTALILVGEIGKNAFLSQKDVFLMNLVRSY